MTGKEYKIATRNFVDEIRGHNNTNGIPHFEITKEFIDKVQSSGIDLKDVLDLLRYVNGSRVIELVSKIISNFYRNTFSRVDYRFLINMDSYPYSNMTVEVKTDGYIMQLNLPTYQLELWDFSPKEIDDIIKRNAINHFVEHFINYQLNDK